MLANMNQSHQKIFNRVSNGVSSRSGNNMTHTHTRSYTLKHKHTRTHTHQYIVILNSRKKKASLDTTRRRRRSVSRWRNLKASEGSKALEEDAFFTLAGSSRNTKH